MLRFGGHQGYADSVRASSEVPLIRQSSAGQSHTTSSYTAFPLENISTPGPTGPVPGSPALVEFPSISN